MLPLERDPKGRVRRGILGLLAGVFLGALLAFAVGMVRKHRASDDPEAARFLALLSETFTPSRASKVSSPDNR
jgi:hypothetical protein